MKSLNKKDKEVYAIICNFLEERESDFKDFLIPVNKLGIVLDEILSKVKINPNRAIEIIEKYNSDTINIIKERKKNKEK